MRGKRKFIQTELKEAILKACSESNDWDEVSDRFRISLSLVKRVVKEETEFCKRTDSNPAWRDKRSGCLSRNTPTAKKGIDTETVERALAYYANTPNVSMQDTGVHIGYSLSVISERVRYAIESNHPLSSLLLAKKESNAHLAKGRPATEHTDTKRRHAEERRLARQQVIEKQRKELENATRN
jgi:hypothetical protein